MIGDVRPMEDLRHAMKEFRFLEDKRQAEGLNVTEQMRHEELRELLAHQQAPAGGGAGFDVNAAAANLYAKPSQPGTDPLAETTGAWRQLSTASEGAPLFAEATPLLEQTGVEGVPGMDPTTGMPYAAPVVEPGQAFAAPQVGENPLQEGGPSAFDFGPVPQALLTDSALQAGAVSHETIQVAPEAFQQPQADPPPVISQPPMTPEPPVAVQPPVAAPSPDPLDDIPVVTDTSVAAFPFDPPAEPEANTDVTSVPPEVFAAAVEVDPAEVEEITEITETKTQIEAPPPLPPGKRQGDFRDTPTDPRGDAHAAPVVTDTAAPTQAQTQPDMAAQLGVDTWVGGEHRVVVHTIEGQVKRGNITDADLRAEALSLATPSAPESIPTAKIKAIFFMLPPGKKPEPGAGARLKVGFDDGRLLEGVSAEYRPEDIGFYLIPTDPRATASRIWIYRAAARQITTA
jgi:hypothetical protein